MKLVPIASLWHLPLSALEYWKISCTRSTSYMLPAQLRVRRVSTQSAQSDSSDGSALLVVPTPYVCLDKNNFTCVHERRWEEAANCVHCWGLTGFSYCEVTRPSQNAEERSGKQPLVSLNKLPCAATQAKEDTLNVLSQLFRLELLQKLSVNVDIKKTSTWQHTNCAHVHVGPWRAGRIQAAHWARRKRGAASLRHGKWLAIFSCYEIHSWKLHFGKIIFGEY